MPPDIDPPPSSTTRSGPASAAPAEQEAFPKPAEGRVDVSPASLRWAFGSSVAAAAAALLLASQGAPVWMLVAFPTLLAVASALALVGAMRAVHRVSAATMPLTGPVAALPMPASDSGGAVTVSADVPQPGLDLLEAVLASAGIGLLEWDVPQDAVTLDRRLRGWFGQPESHPAGSEGHRPLSMQEWIGWVHPQDVAALWDAMRRHLEGQAPSFDARARLRHSDGVFRGMRITGCAVQRTAQGLPWRIVAVHQPLDAAFSAAATGSPVRVAWSSSGSKPGAAPNADSGAAPHRPASEQPNDQDGGSLNRLAVARLLAQRLRVPLRTVLGLADVLAGSHGITHEPQTTAANLQTAARSLERALDELLDLALAEAGQLPLETTDLVIAPIVENVCDRLAATAAARDVQLHVHLPTDPVDRIHGDADRVRQVVTHLVERAIQRSVAELRPGIAAAGSASGLARRPEVRVRVTRSALSQPNRAADGAPLLPAVMTLPELCVEVQDNGPSADPANLGQPFGPQFNGWGGVADPHQAEADPPFSLALARCLVQRMGGRLELVNREGVGQVVRVWWAAARQVPDASAPGARLDGARVVLVEGGVDLPAATIKSWLTQQGAHVQRCASVQGVAAAVSRLRGIDASARVDEPVLVIQDDSAAVSDPLERAGLTAQDTLALQPVRHLLVGRGRRTTLRMASPTVALIDVLRRQVFVDAVASVIGRLLAPDTAPMAFKASSKGKRPIAAAAQAAEASADDWLLGARVAPPTPEQARERGLLVLVVEPEPMPRAVLARQLGLLGYACEAVGSTVEALHAWQQAPHAMAFVSLQMADGAAFQWVDELRRVEAERRQGRMPVVGITAAASASEAARARSGGADDYLSRPLPLLSLLACLNQWMPAPRRRTAAQGATDIDTDTDTLAGAFLPIGTPQPGWSSPGTQSWTPWPLLPQPMTAPAESPPTLPARLESALPPIVESRSMRDPAAVILDVDGLRRLVGDNDQVVRELLLDFLQLAGRHARDFREAVQSRDADRAHWVAKQLRGVAHAVGASGLAEVCIAIEASGGDAAQVALQLGPFDTAFHAVCARIDDALRSAAP